MILPVLKKEMYWALLCLHWSEWELCHWLQWRQNWSHCMASETLLWDSSAEPRLPESRLQRFDLTPVFVMLPFSNVQENRRKHRHAAAVCCPLVMLEGLLRHSGCTWLVWSLGTRGWSLLQLLHIPAWDPGITESIWSPWRMVWPGRHPLAKRCPSCAGSSGDTNQRRFTSSVSATWDGSKIVIAVTCPLAWWDGKIAGTRDRQRSDTMVICIQQTTEVPEWWMTSRYDQ